MRARIFSSPKQIEDVISLYQNGYLSCQDIAIRFGVAKNTIRNVLLREGVELSNKILVISRKAKVRPSHRKGAKHSQKSKDKMSLAHKGHKRCVGRKYSSETIEKMRASAIKRVKNDPLFVSRLYSAKKLLSPDEKRLRIYYRSSYKSLIRNVLRKTKIKKNSSSCQLLGYTNKQFVSHIEEQFTENMSWDNRSSFHIDHKVPIIEFIKRGIIAPRIINALINLRPLDPMENKRKSAKYNSNNWSHDISCILASI